MEDNRPSTTAMRVAFGRAAHRLLDVPLVFDDPLALRILGPDVEETIANDVATFQSPPLRALRAFLVARSRYSEDAAEATFARGVRQCVVLGAGLDTFAYRHEHSSVFIFEVDHPATQSWKRDRLADAGIEVPPHVIFAPVDFERQTLAEGLRAAGFDSEAPAFFSWLGVTPYLTRSAVISTLQFIRNRPRGSEIVFDFAPLPELLTGEGKQWFETFSARVAAMGEPWVTFFEPSDLANELCEMGFADATPFAPDDINALYFDGRKDNLRTGALGHLMHARV
ncbi:class I SAM-dependent methyltransferase [Pendulispora rubella]|uniref:S-adenosyl-L-methionine-dependent methyltransferase n=1 Tax=Pendulispora rubella TaxID=2741070 RepID=A0ABZ2LL42_9BACT